jgi:hypothetical protein
MTRVFGFEVREKLPKERIRELVDELFQTMQDGLKAVLDRKGVAYGLGFIVAYEDGAVPVTIYKGYKGITQDDSIRELFESEYQIPEDKKIKAIFGLIQCDPDISGNEPIQRQYKFPWEADQWYVMTAGNYAAADFSDVSWNDQEAPWYSLVNYLNTNPENINFDWINKEVAPIIMAVRKDGSEILFEDQFTGNNSLEKTYKVEDHGTHIVYSGIRDSKDRLT